MARAIVVCALALVALLAGCYGAGTPCGDDHCLAGTVCTADRDHCVYPEQLTSCAGLTDGTVCDIRGLDGACRASLCLPVVCGDGFVQPGEEECDGALLGGHTDCLSLGEGYHSAGRLSCTADCTLDRSACGDRCGDGITQAPAEACDVTVGAQTCDTAGFHGGTLGCTPDCQLDVSSCDGWCGDGRRTSEEECDGTDFGLTTCNTFGFYGGSLRCTAACKLEQDLCVGKCGDGVANGPEICDGEHRPGLSCQLYGYYEGDVTCGDDCLSVSRAECEGYCGDGVQNGNELCDGLDHGANSCVRMGALAGEYECNAFCQPISESCYWGTLRPQATPPLDSLRRVWGTASDDLWIAGVTEVTHFNGTRWSRPVVLPGDGSDWISRAWSTGRDESVLSTETGDVYAITPNTIGLVHRTEVSEAGAWGPASDDVWMASSDAIHRYRTQSSQSWRPEPAYPYGNAEIWGTSPSNIWAAKSQSLYQYQDDNWTLHNLPGVDTLSMWGTDGRNMFAARAFIDGDDSNLFRFDGSTWHQVNIAPLARVFGGQILSATRSFVWGHRGGQECIASHRQGRSELVECMTSIGVPIVTPDERLWTILGSELYMKDGPAWSFTPLPAQVGGHWVMTPGRGEFLFVQDGILLRQSRGQASVPVGPSGVDNFWAYPGGAWAINSWSATHVRGDQVSTYSLQLSRPTGCAFSATNAWFGDHNGIWHFDGSRLSLAAHLSRGVEVLRCAPDGSLWMLDSDRLTVARLDGSSWTEVFRLEPSDGGRISSIVPVHRTDAWIFYGNVPIRYNGSLTRHPQQVGMSPGSAAAARSPRDVWITQWGEPPLHFDGNRWSRVAVAPDQNYNSVSINSSGEVWLGGENAADIAIPWPRPYGGLCKGTMPTYCNVSLQGHTAQTGDGPTSCSGGLHIGGELHYKIHVAVTGTMTAQLQSRYDVDLSVVRADHRGGCDVASCVGTSIGDNEIELSVQQGQTYFLVVGARDEAAPFTLDVDCVKE